MKTRQLAIGLLAAPLLLAGCAAGNHSGRAAENLPQKTGQTMAGMTMATMSAVPAAQAPSEAAKMVCSQDIRDQVGKVLGLSTPAPVRASWQDQLYSCTYALPMGTMVLSVKQSAGKAAAGDYFAGLRRQLGRTAPLLGLGEQAYATTTGTAVVLKDNFTLRVDTTGLPAVFGPQRQRRTDLAYEIASDVLGCWTGDE